MRLSAGNAGVEDIDQRTFISPEFLGQFSKTRLDRVKQQNLLALGPVVYRPDLKLEIGLFSVQSDERVMGMLGMLNRLAESASLPRVSEALPFARALGDGLDLVLGFKDGLRLEVGLGQGIGDHSPAGRYALIFNDDDRVSLQKLFVQPNGALVEGRKGRQLQRPHIVFEIATQQTREDWGRLPDLREGWQRVREAASTDQTSEALEASLRTFQRQVLVSPDLTATDARLIASLVREKMGDLRNTYESAGGATTLDPGPLEGFSTAADEEIDGWRPEGADASVSPSPSAAAPDFPAISTYEREYQDAIAFLLAAEGGKVDNKNDIGGRTNRGITQKTFNEWRVAKQLPALDVFDISEEEAVAIYYEKYWRAASCREVKDSGLGLVMLDTAVLCGTARPVRFLQLALLRYLDVKKVNRSKLDDRAVMAFFDGQFGPLTLDTLERARAQGGIPKVIASFLALRAGFHRAKVVDTKLDRHQGQFIGGWLNRLAALHEAALKVKPSPSTYSIWAPAEISGRLESLGVEEYVLDLDDDGVDDGSAHESFPDTEITTKASTDPVEVYSATLAEAFAKMRNPASLAGTLKRDRAVRRFDKVHLGSLVARTSGAANPAVRNLEVQALNELKQYAEARALAAEVIKGAEPQIDVDLNLRSAWTEASGHLGRAFKQQYVDWMLANPGVSPGAEQQQLLRQAVSAYFGPFEKFGDACLWHAINVVALLARGRADKVDLSAYPDHLVLAKEIAASVERRTTRLSQLAQPGASLSKSEDDEKSYLEGEREWDIATAAEAQVALGNYQEAKRLYGAYITASVARAVASHSSEAFNLESAYRQLDEVWRLGASDVVGARALMASMKLARARAPGSQIAFKPDELAHLAFATFESADGQDDLLDAQTQALEAVYDGYRVLPALAWHERFREAMCAIARVDLNRKGVDGKRPPKGSGFLIDGGELRAAWKGRSLFITNAHVVYPEPEKFVGPARPIRPESAIVTFTVAEPDKEYRISRVLWLSRHHDVVVCELDAKPAIRPLTDIELELPAADELYEITVVGHPGGREMSFAPSNLKLERHDGPDTHRSGRPVLLHYRASTEPGNSGSPAFNWRTMRLVGVHHAGRGSVFEYQRNGGKQLRIDRGMADVNEAIAICSVREAVSRKTT